jgi:hypothetical protein
VVHLDITTEVRTRRVWVYNDKLDPWYKSTWFRNGVIICTKIQSYANLEMSRHT